MSKNKINYYRFPILFLIWGIHGIIALWQYLSSEKINLPISSVSNVYLVILLVLIVWSLFFTLLSFLSIKQQDRNQSWENWLLRSKTVDWVLLISIVGFLCLLIIWVIFGFSSATPKSLIDNYLRIFSPVLILLTCILFETILFVLINDGVEIKNINPQFAKKILTVLSFLSITWLMISSTQMGILPSYKGDWSRGLPAVPLFEWHILVAIFFLVFTTLLDLNEKIAGFKYLDILICFLIWGSASLIWASQPVMPNASALEPHEPNYEIYPFIDSQTYDQLAQSVLVGNGFDNSIPPRALYITFLSFMHLIVGQDYESMILLQSLIFALFPVLLYIFGKYYFGRPIGVSIALLAIFRDFTSNLVSPFTGNLSYSKVLMSEIPTAMFLVLLLILGFRWIKSEFPIAISFLIGGVLGLAMLIRTQTSVVLPMIIIFGALVYPYKIKRLLISSLTILLSLLLVISPWLWRNWSLTGEVIFDSPEYQIANLALRYSRLNGIEPNIMALPDESYPEYNGRLKEMAINAIRSNPQLALWGVLNTFLNHGVNNILLLPLRYELVDLEDIWVPEDAFWEEWVGTPSVLQTFLLMFYVFLFGMGVSTVWHRHGILGLLPLGVNFAYNFWTSLALLSGQRFMVSMDWSIYFYYMTGFFTLLGGLGMLFKRGNVLVQAWISKYFYSKMDFTLYSRSSVFTIVGFGFIFLIAGSSPVLIERVFPERYPVLSNTQVLSGLLNSSSVQQADIARCLGILSQQELLTYVQGRALYPRYYPAGDGERFTDAFGYRVVDEDRIVFEIIGQRNGRVVMPVLAYPHFFPQASDVTLVYGTDASPWFILVKKGEEERFYISKNFTPLICE